MDLEKTMQDISLNPTFLDGLQILLMIAIAYAATATMTFILERLAGRFPARRLFFKRLQPFFQLIGYGIPAYLIIRILSPDQDSLMAMLYASAFAIGFAAQDLLKDLIGGIVVLVDTSFQVGDRIRVDDFYGEVVKIGLRSTKMMTPDNEVITLPNSQLLQAALTNVNAGTVDSPITTHVYLPPHADIDRIERAVREVVLTSKAICRNKPLSIAVKESSQDGQTMIDMEIHAYVFDVRFEETFLTDITRRTKQVIFDRGLLVEEAEIVDQRIDANLADTLIALGKRFADYQPSLPHHNGH